MQNKIIYIAEFSLPNMSAYTVHVLKMCDSFSYNNKVELLIPFCSNSYNFKKIQNEYLLKNNFKIKSIFNSKIKNTLTVLMNTSYPLMVGGGLLDIGRSEVSV